MLLYALCILVTRIAVGAFVGTIVDAFAFNVRISIIAIGTGTAFVTSLLQIKCLGSEFIHIAA